MKKTQLLILLTFHIFSSVAMTNEITLCFDDKANQTQIDSSGVLYLSSMDFPFTGKNLCKYEEGQLKFEKNYKDGRASGTWNFFYENGQKQKVESYKDGIEHGNFIDWEINTGLVKSKEGFNNGRKIYTTVFKYYENGQSKSEKNYSDKKPSGEWTFWYENGQMRKIENYKDGIIDGRFLIGMRMVG